MAGPETALDPALGALLRRNGLEPPPAYFTRAVMEGVAAARPATPARVPQKRATPGEFFAQVRDEARKVTWPSRRETTITTIMVFVMVVAASRFVVGLILGV